ncbi:GNAT family N-acetyltransferase [Paenibacillus marinisediminis]
MIYEADIHLRRKLIPMFEHMPTMIMLSSLQGHMGTAWVDDLSNPTVAQVIVGVCIFYAGDPNAEAAEELLLHLPEDSLVIVDSDEWKERIEAVHYQHKHSIEKLVRYAFKKDPAHLDRKHIQSFLSALPEGYELRKIDHSIASDPSLHKLSEDFTGQFNSIEDYLHRGIGYCILHEGQVVCGASSYSIYDHGIEIELATHPEHRRLGLATAATSALIVDCLDRGIYPSYDAANAVSAALAQKLGYILHGSYDTYYIHIDRSSHGADSDYS